MSSVPRTLDMPVERVNDTGHPPLFIALLASMLTWPVFLVAAIVTGSSQLWLAAAVTTVGIPLLITGLAVTGRWSRAPGAF